MKKEYNLKAAPGGGLALTKSAFLAVAFSAVVRALLSLRGRGTGCTVSTCSVCLEQSAGQRGGLRQASSSHAR